MLIAQDGSICNNIANGGFSEVSISGKSDTNAIVISTNSTSNISPSNHSNSDLISVLEELSKLQEVNRLAFKQLALVCI